MSSISQNLIGLRRARNLERKDVCKAFGLLPRSYARYETGLRVPSLELLGEFARYYGVTVDYLIGQTDLVSKEECLQETLEMIKELGGVAGEIASSALEEWCYKEKAV
ncbi:helix-turn-helix domain-containing protein [Lactococcus petauri]|uniref:helix-turn-helix domain-containing protein n=1 Tax=Lactococcus petauri TaxID=1940789 RepID=UPI00254C8E7A|nr:helix-turn-helix transcriptional regulator [Lactococcus petauri]